MKANAKEGTLELNKTAKALSEIAGIDVYTDSSKTSVKDMVTIIEEVKGKWGELTQAQQLGLSEAIAGKHQSAVFNALMSNWQRVRQFQDEYNKGWMVGSAQRENELFLDSIQGKWNTLRENLKGFVTGNFSTDMAKGLLDSANNIVVAIDKITQSLGKIGTVSAGAGIVSFFKNMANLKNFSASTSGVLGFLNKLAMLPNIDFSGVMNVGGLVTGLKNLATASGVAKVAMVALNSVLTAFAVGAVITVVAELVKAWDDYAHATEKAVEASKQRQDGIRDEMQTLSTQKSSLSSIAEEYDKLSSKTSLTADEHERLAELKREIADIEPNLVAGYDSANNPILSLNGSLQDYINSLDDAIKRQETLFNLENSRQADEYMNENDKKPFLGENRVEKWKKERMNPTAEKNYWDNKYEYKYTENAKKFAKERQDARETEAKNYQHYIDSISTMQAEQVERDSSIQSKYVQRFTQSSKLNEKNLGQFTSFMNKLDWGSFTRKQADEMSKGLQSMSQKTAFTLNQLGSDIKTKTEEATKSFKETGALQSYGKALQGIAKESKTFDMQSWSTYLDEVNKKFADGAYDANEYEHALGYMAETIAEIGNIPVENVLESLLGQGDWLANAESSLDGLNKFLKGYSMTIEDVNAGNDSAMKLRDQFNELKYFAEEFDNQVIEGNIKVDWLLEEANSGSLPKQMADMINLVASDNEVTEVEQRVLMAVEAEIENKGQLQEDTIATIEGLLDGTLNIDKGIEINGLELSRYEAEALKNELQEAGITAKDLKLGETGLEKAQKQAEELKKAVSEIKNVELRVEVKKLNFNNADELKRMQDTMDGMNLSEDKKVTFTAECGQFFVGANSVEEAIQKMPPETVMRWGIKCEGIEGLEEAQSIYNSLPKEVKTAIKGEAYGYEDMQMIADLVNTLGNTNAVAVLEIEGIQESLSNCTSFKEVLQTIQEFVVSPEVELKGKDELIKGLEEALSKLEETDKAEAKPKVKAESDDKDLDNTNKKLDETDGRKTTSQHKAESDDKELDKTKEKQKDVSKTTKGEHKAKSDDKDLDKTKEKIQVLTQDTHGNITLHVQGTNEVVQATVDKDRLEVNGKAITTVQVDGVGQFNVAINDKNQLEVNGVAQTDIKIGNGEQLKFAINDKNQLEVNGQAITNVKILGSGEIKQTQQEKDKLQQDGSATIDLNTNMYDLMRANDEINNMDGKQVGIDITLKQGIESILAKLGLDKSTANVEINITCRDEATPKLKEISGYQDKQVQVTITANDSGVAEKLNNIKSIQNTSVTISVSVSSPTLPLVKSQLDSISTMMIPTKTFNVSCPNIGSVSSQISMIATKVIPNKSFSVSCNDGGALSKINSLATRVIPTKQFSVICSDQASARIANIISRQIPNKTFNINCSDNASSKISIVQAKKISNKSFTISCNDNASYKIASIKASLSGLHSKTVTVTVYKNTVSKGGGNDSVNPPRVEALSTIMNTPRIDNSGIVTALNDNAKVVNATARETNNNVVKAMASRKTSINAGKTLTALKYNVDLLNNMSNILSRIDSQLREIDGKQKRAWGGERLKLIEQEISLLTKQRGLLSTNLNNMSAMQKKLKSNLKSKGFDFNDDGSIRNYSSKLISIEKQIESLDKKSSSSKIKDKTKKKYEKQKESLEQTKKVLQEYYNLTFSEMPNVKAEWQDVANSIVDAKNELMKTELEMETFKFTAQIEISEAQIDRNDITIDTLKVKMELVGIKEQISLLKQANDFLQANMDKQQIILDRARKRAGANRDVLEQYGFNFTKMGYLKSGASDLKKVAGKDEYEAIKEAYDQYVEDMYTTIPQAEKEWYELQVQIKENKEEIEEITKKQNEFVKNSKLSVLEHSYEMVNKQLDLLSSQTDNAFGSNKNSLIKNQISKTQELINKQIELGETQRQLAQESKKELISKYSIKFDSKGNMVNLEGVMKNLGSLDDMEKLQELADKYNDSMKNWSESNIEVEDLKGQVQDLKDELIDLNDELNEIIRNAWVTELENDMTVLENKLDSLEIKKELSGQNKVDLLNEQLSIYKQQTAEISKSLDYYNKLSKKMSSELISYGFEINDDGTIDGVAEKLELLRNSMSETEFDHVNELLKDYFDVAIDKIPELENALLEQQKKQEDLYKEKLEYVEKVEDEVTNMIKDQVDKRIEAIKKESEATVKSLNKAKDAYNKYREEVDYKDDYDKQLKIVQDLERQVEIAKRSSDTITGQKRLEDLMAQLKEEQESLKDLTEDRMDDLVNDMFDNEIEKVETDAEDKIKDIENVWTDSKIAEVVKEALQTGIN